MAWYEWLLVMTPIWFFILILMALCHEDRYEPMAPDEEVKWLRGMGLTNAEIEEIVD